MATLPAFACPHCKGALEYHVTIEMLDPPVGKVDTGYCTICERLFERVRDTETYYDSTLWPPLCRQCRQPVVILEIASAGTAVYECRDHRTERWTWDRSTDFWRRLG